MKKFIGEFKKFISRGNVVDMAIGVIIGSAFTAIVTAITKNVLQPLINGVLAAIFGSSSLSGIYTYIKVARVNPADPTSAIDVANSIYIDWGALINAVINFLLIALVLFTILKVVNTIREKNEKISQGIISSIPNRKDRKEMRKQGIKLYDRNAVKAFMDKKEAEAKAAAEEKAKAEQLALEEAKKHSTEYLLEQIKEILEKQQKQ